MSRVKRKTHAKRAKGSGARRPKRARKRRAGAKRAAPRRAKAKASPRARKHAARPKRAAGAKRGGEAKRGAGAKRGAKPSLRLVRRAAKKPAPPVPPAFPQTADASAKQRLLFELVRAHASVAAAIQGMLPETAERPMGEGKWTVRETVLHLVTRDRIRLRELEGVLRGAEPSWRRIEDEEQDRINERDLAALRHLPWDEAVRLLHGTRRELMEMIESIPDEPATVWEESHPFGWMMLRLPGHDRHHADAIKSWRGEAGE